jgi:hypothetical protein
MYWCLMYVFVINPLKISLINLSKFKKVHSELSAKKRFRACKGELKGKNPSNYAAVFR